MPQDPRNDYLYRLNNPISASLSDIATDRPLPRDIQLPKDPNNPTAAYERIVAEAKAKNERAMAERLALVRALGVPQGVGNLGDAALNALRATSKAYIR